MFGMLTKYMNLVDLKLDEILASHDAIMKKLDIVITRQVAMNRKFGQYSDEIRGDETTIKHLEAHAGIQ